MFPLESLPVQLYNQRWNLIHMPKPCMIALTTAFVNTRKPLNCSVPYCPWKSYIPHITTNACPYLPLYFERLYDHLDLSEIKNPRVPNENCFDRFEEVQSTLKISTHYEETHDVSTTYMGKICPTGRNFEFDNQIFVSGSCTSHGTLMDKAPMRVLLTQVPAKFTCPSPFYIVNTGLHTLPKFSTSSKGIIVRNHQLVPVIFIIPVKCSF